MFKLRPGGQGNASPSQPPTIEAVRRRARHRLIGASVLVLAGVIGLPLLFDTQPRPIPVDIPIDIPAKSTAKPLSLPSEKPQASATKVDGLSEGEEAVAKAPAKVESLTASAQQAPAKVEAPAKTETPTKPEAPASKPVEPAPAPKPAPAPESAKPAAAPAPTDAARAQALLDGKAASNARVVVQVGAFADQARAREVRQRLERAGLKTYTHVADTPEGKRIRVRLGPFDTRADAEKAANKVKGLGLPAAILTL